MTGVKSISTKLPLLFLKRKLSLTLLLPPYCLYLSRLTRTLTSAFITIGVLWFIQNEIPAQKKEEREREREAAACKPYMNP